MRFSGKLPTLMPVAYNCQQKRILKFVQCASLTFDVFIFLFFFRRYFVKFALHVNDFFIVSDDE